MEGARRSTTVKQLRLLVEFLETNTEVALGRLRSLEAREVATRLWREIADSLNREGPARLPKEWARVWNDMKCRVRAKLNSLAVSQQSTCGPISNVSLTPLEYRVVNVIGWNVGSIANVGKDPLEVSMEDNQEMVMELVEQIDDRHSLPSLSFSQPSPRPSSPPPPPPSLPPPPPSLPPSPSSTPPPRRRQHKPYQKSQRGKIDKSRSALEESRAMMIRIEELRAHTDNLLAQSALKQAEAARAQAEAAVLTAQSNRLQAQTMSTISQSLSVLVPAVKLYIENRTQSKEK